MNLPADYNDLSVEGRRVVRNEYVKIQKGLCHHCHAPLDSPVDGITKEAWPVNKKLFPPSFFKYPVHLHHNHDTGMTLGAVHAYCNAVLWQYHGE